MKKAIPSLLVFFAVCSAVLLMYGFSENGPFSHSDASSTDLVLQQQLQAQTLQNSPKQFNSGYHIEAMAINPDTICYKGPVPAYPSGFFGHGSDWLGDTLYIAGGSATGTASVSVYRYSFSGDNWSAGRDMPVAKVGGKLVKCGSALYYIGGGSALGAAGGTTPTLKYTPAGGWEQVAPIPSITVGNTAECWGDSVIFCIAGGWTEYFRGIQVYRPATNSWSRAIDSLPAGMGRRAHASGIVGNKIFVSCGYSGAFRNDTQIGTIGANANIITWTTAPAINCRGGMSRPGGIGIDGYFYVVGCETSPAPAQQDSIFRFNVNTSTWETPLKGRGTGAASNYWGAISAQVVGGRTNIYIPGGNVTGTTTWGFYVARSGGCSLTPPPPVGNTLVITNDSTTPTTPRIADRDTLKKYVNMLVGNVTYMTKNTTTVFPSLAGYNTIIFQETSFDATTVRSLVAAQRQALKDWLASGTPSSKKSLIMIGGDLGYAYDQAGVAQLDTVFSRSYGGFQYVLDNGAPVANAFVGQVPGTLFDAMSTTPPGTNYWPDGCKPISGGATFNLYKFKTDTIAGVSKTGAGWNVVSTFQDPRYYTGAGDGTGDVGFKRVLKNMIAWVVANNGIITGVTPVVNTVAKEYSLSQNYPNPFNPTTKINFSIPANGFVSLKIYDIVGKQVATLVNKNMTVGTHSIEFDGSYLSSGIYFYRIETGSFVETKKMMLVK